MTTMLAAPAPAPTSYLAEQITVLSGQVSALQEQAVSYTAGTVTAVDNVALSFTVNVPQPDGTQLEVVGISGVSAQFMPVIGMTVNLALSGAQLIYQPAGITPGSIGLGQTSTNGPGVPGDVSATSAAATNADGTTSASISITWTAPTTNLAGGPVTEAPTYIVATKSTLKPAWTEFPSTALTALVPAVSGVGYDVKVASVDRLGNRSAWSETVSILGGRDTVAPGQPSTLTVGNYLGQLKITWDGKLNGGLALPADFARLEVYVSSTSGFTPSGVPTLVMPAGGTDYADVPYGETRYVRAVAVDMSGNRSAPSAQGSGSSSKVVSDDIFEGAVGSQQLALLAVKTANLDNLAVNDAKVGSLSVGKLVSGIMSADVVIGGRFATALKGARTELNALGFQKFNADETLAISLTATQTLLSGVYRTALSGTRIEMGTAGVANEIRFYSPTGTLSVIKAYTESNGTTDSLQLGLPITNGHYLWNRININDYPQIAYHTNWHEFGMTDTGQFNIGQYDGIGSFGTGLFYRLEIRPGGFVLRRPSNRIFFDAIQGADSERVRILPGATGGCDILNDAANTTNSARVQLNQGNGGGGIVKVYAGGIECRNQADSLFAPCVASVFTVGSDKAFKNNIEDAAIDGAAVTKAMRVRKYTIKGGKKDDGPELDIPQLGLVAQEAPPEVVVEGLSDGMLGIDLGQTVNVHTLTLQQILTRLEALETDRKAKA